MTAPKTPQQVLLEAADLIERDGLAKGTFFDPDTGCRCTYGALFKAKAGKDEGHSRDVAVEANVIVDALGLGAHFGYDEFSLITEWNDAPERTADEVVAGLRKAAEVTA